MPTTKHYRLSIDFHVTIADTPPLLSEGTIEPPDEEYDARQARLLEALRNDSETLQRWIRDMIAWKMEGHSLGHWLDVISGGDIALHEILFPVIATLSEDDQEFFREGVNIGYFEEYVDMVQKSFVVEEGKPVIEELLPDFT